jgi:hypothetical protein
MKRLFRISRLLHKYIGLLLLLVLMVMSATGILLNHPSLLADWDLPQQVLGESYRYDNWNRFSFRDSVVLEDGTVIIGGKLGVFSGKPDKPEQGTLSPMNEGLPRSLYLKDTSSLLAVNDQGSIRLYAGTRGGLYTRTQEDKKWQQVSTPSGDEHIVDLLSSDGRILAFTPFSCLVSDKSISQPVFREISIPFLQTTRKIPLFRLLFSLHSGKVFGTTGRLLVDIAAAGLIFLCLSAFYIWLFSKKPRLFPRQTGKRLFTFSFRNHLKIGIWLALPLLIIALSGTFIRPPLIILANSLQIPVTLLRHEAHEILKAEIIEDTLIIATHSGWYRGNAKLNAPLEPFTPPFPVFGMGITVLERLSGKIILAGSFSGLFYWDLVNDVALDLQGQPVSETDTMRPSEVMAAGALIHDEKLIGYADYSKGIQKVGATPQPLLEMWPKELSSYRISLYHFLFELHNGRLLRDFIGRWYILFVPITGIVFVTVIISGIFDWYWRRKPFLK